MAIILTTNRKNILQPALLAYGAFRYNDSRVPFCREVIDNGPSESIRNQEKMSATLVGGGCYQV